MTITIHLALNMDLVPLEIYNMLSFKNYPNAHPQDYYLNLSLLYYKIALSILSNQEIEFK